MEVPVLKNMDIGLLWEGYKLLETVQEVKEEIMVDDKDRKSTRLNSSH